MPGLDEARRPWWLGLFYFVAKLAVNLVLAGAVGAAYLAPPVAGFDASSYRILVLAIGTVVFIVFGPRLAIERWLEHRSVPGREAWASVLALMVALSSHDVTMPLAMEVFADKIDIIALILSFAMVSDGLGRSGYFHYAAYYIVEKCNGNTARLSLYLFILTSIFTFFTSNDIVILVLTPIIISVAAHARITNLKLILLSQFVAANTLSMGLLVGSPTNIILGEALHLNFFSYLTLMFVPAVLSFLISFAVVDFLNQRGRRSVSGSTSDRSWTFYDSYETPNISAYSTFTPDMRNWLTVFFAAVALVSLITFAEQQPALRHSLRGGGLLWAAIPIAAAAAWLYVSKAAARRHTDKRPVPLFELATMLRRLPYGILFFGMTFFIFARALADSELFERTIVPYLQTALTSDLSLTGIIAAIVSGLSVNIFNDLPASALLAQIWCPMEQTAEYCAAHGMIAFDNGFQHTLATQGILIGVNIGCYLTPIGALAGLIWFNTMAKARRDILAEASQSDDPYVQQLAQNARDMVVPGRLDLLRYGVIHFAVAVTLLGLLLPFLALIGDFLISPTRFGIDSKLTRALAGDITMIPTWGLWWIGAATSAGMLLWFAVSLERNKVALTHLRDAFVIFNGLQLWANRHKVLFGILLGVMVIVGSGALLYAVEQANHRLYHLDYENAAKAGHEAPNSALFEGARTFIVWFLVFVGSGFEFDLFPRSVLGMALVGLLPFVLLSFIIYTFRALTRTDHAALSERIAIGDLPAYRCVVLNYQPVFDSFVRGLIANKRNFVILLTDGDNTVAANVLIKELFGQASSAHRAYVAQKRGAPEVMAERYNLTTADEIYLLSDRTDDTEYENLRFLTLLDRLAPKISDGAPAAHKPSSAERTAYQAKIPRIVLETMSSRTCDLVQRSVSRAMLDHTIIVGFDRKLAEFLRADASPNLALVNEFFGFGRSLSAREAAVFQGEGPPAAVELKEYRLTPESAELIRGHFAWRTDADKNHIRESATSLRARLESAAAGATYVDAAGQRQPVDFGRLYGFSMLCADARVRLSVHSASICRQVETLDGVVLMGEAATQPQQLRGSKGRILIINANPIASAFVEALVDDAGRNTSDEILVFANNAQRVPEPVMRAGAEGKITLFHDFKPGVEALVDQLAPVRLEDYKGDASAKYLRKADRVYVFLGEGAHGGARLSNPDVDNVDFVDNLHERLASLREEADASGASFDITHRNIYIAVEAPGRGRRFLFEHLFIDEFFDSSWIRQSYFETLALSFHLPQTAQATRSDFARTGSDFRRAHLISDALCRFVVVRAKDVRLNLPGGGMKRVLGLSALEAAREIRSFSDPHMQLFGVLRMELDDYARLRFKSFGVTEPIVLHEDDLLLNIPLI